MLNPVVSRERLRSDVNKSDKAWRNLPNVERSCLDGGTRRGEDGLLVGVDVRAGVLNDVVPEEKA